MSSTPPGWYPDPEGQLRWWDGTRWGVTADGVRAQGAGGPGAGGPQPGDTTLAMLAHLLAIFTWFIGPLVIYLSAGNRDPFVRHHAAESLNFQITWFVAMIASAALICLLIGFVLFPVVALGALILEIVASIAANRGEWYRYPVNLRLVSGAQG